MSGDESQVVRDALFDWLARLAAEQHVAVEQTRLQPALDRDPILRSVPLPELLELRADLAAERNARLLSEGQVASSDDPMQCSYRALPGDGTLFLRFGAALLRWWQPHAIAASGGMRGAPESELVQRDEPVLALAKGQLVSGAFEALDWLGRPVVREPRRYGAHLHVSDWDSLRVLRPASWLETPPVADVARSTLIGLEPAIASDMPEKMAEAFELLLAREVIAGRTLGRFIDAFVREGYSVTFHGGAVRDVYHRLHLDPALTPAALAAGVEDIDMITSLPIDRLRAVAARLVPEIERGGFLPLGWTDQLGISRLQPWRCGATGQGFDAAQFHHRLFFNRGAAIASDARRPLTSLFDHNLEEDAWLNDYTMNTLLAHRDFSSGRWQLLDPLGCALDHVRERVVAVARDHGQHELHNNLRFWKFRLRGFRAPVETRLAIGEWMRRDLPRVSVVTVARSLHTFMAAEAKSDSGLGEVFLRLRSILDEDGHGDLFEPYLMRPELHAALRALADASAVLVEAAAQDDDSAALDAELDQMFGRDGEEGGGDDGGQGDGT